MRSSRSVSGAKVPEEVVASVLGAMVFCGGGANVKEGGSATGKGSHGSGSGCVGVRV